MQLHKNIEEYQNVVNNTFNNVFHNSGCDTVVGDKWSVRRSDAIKNRTPLILIHYEYFINRTDAKAREVFLKSGYGREQFHQILKHTIFDL